MICQNHCSLVISILTTDATGHTVVELTVARLHIRMRYSGSVPWRLLYWYRNVCLSRVSTYPINTHDENMNDYRCCNIWIVRRSEVSYWRNPMHHWTVHTTKPSTAVILISLPMMISNDHSSCIFINVHTGDHSQLCRKLQWYWQYW